MQLAWWHTFKTGCQKIYEKFLPHCIAPILVNVFPAVNLKVHPSLASISVTLTTFRLAYEELTDDVDDALATNLELNLAQKNTLHDMKDLCQFFIPTVSWSIVKKHHVHCLMVGAGQGKQKLSLIFFLDIVSRHRTPRSETL